MVRFHPLSRCSTFTLRIFDEAVFFIPDKFVDLDTLTPSDLLRVSIKNDELFALLGQTSR